MMQAPTSEALTRLEGMLSPLLGIAGVNSLLFAAYGTSKRIISPYPDLSLKEIAAAGGLRCHQCRVSQSWYATGGVSGTFLN